MASDILHQLVHTLTRTEKAYFKKFYRKTNKEDPDNLYIKLFDLVEHQENYEEKSILKKLNPQKNAKQFAASKVYLYNVILDCLNDYHFSKSVDAQLFKQLDQIQILNNKGLYEQALKLVYKTQKTAEEYERFIVLLKLQEWESQLLHFAGKFDELNVFLEHGFDKDDLIIAQWKAYRTIQKKVVQLFVLSRQYAIVRDVQDLKKLEAIAQELEIIEGTSLSLRGAFLLYFGLFHYYYFSKTDILSADKYSTKRVSLFESNPHFLSTSRYSYIHSLNLVLITKCKIEDWDLFERYLDTLSNFATQSIEEEVGIFEVYSQNLLNYINKIQKKDDRIRQIEINYERYKGQLKIDFRISIQFLLGVYYWQEGEWQNALIWLDKLEMKEKTYIDHQVAAKLMKIIIHYELGNLQFLEHLISTTNRFIRNQERMYEVEKRFIKLFTKLQTAPPLHTKQQLISDFRGALLLLKQQPFEVAIFDLFNPLIWVDRCLGNSKGK